jgi:hypothetical protein
MFKFQTINNIYNPNPKNLYHIEDIPEFVEHWYLEFVCVLEFIGWDLGLM